PNSVIGVNPSQPTRLGARVERLVSRERDEYLRGAEASRLAWDRARRTIPGGVLSNAQNAPDVPLFIAGGECGRIRDVAGREYVDFHACFGALLTGHAHPQVTRVLKLAAEHSTSMGAPTPQAAAVSELLHDRFSLPYWRFTNSGTEATMAAIRLA